MAAHEKLAARSLEPSLVEPLLEFFEGLDEEDRNFFHPHGLGREDAERLCDYAGKDTYRVMMADGQILVYGILRGNHGE